MRWKDGVRLGGGQVASVLLSRVSPHPDDASELLITLAERIAQQQYASLGEDDRPILVAQLLQLAETKGRILVSILDTGFWILDPGFWILDSGFWRTCISANTDIC